MKRSVTLILFPLLLIAGTSFGLTLSENGQTGYTIVVEDGASGTEKTAALELQRYLNLVTGADFSIQPLNKISGPAILIGPSEKVKKLASDVDWVSLGTEGIAMKTVGDDLLLAGGEPRGTLYAVYTFLEDIVGVRWWTATENFIPKKPTLQIDSLNVTYVPQFQYRELLCRGIDDDLTFTAKLKINGSWQRIPENYGGHFQILGYCHTFYPLLPPDRYFKKHPEWYSLIDGKRTYQSAQLCLTNDEMRKEFTKNALEWIRQNPSAGIISISQNDGGGECQCEKCQALAKAEGSESGPLLHFVNAVAADIAKEYPNFKVETLAYCYTQEPPLHVKPADNVVIRLCSTGTYQDRPLTDQVNATFQNQIKKWSPISKNLFVWYYTTNYHNYIVPVPNLYNWQTDLRFLAKNHVFGVLAQDNRTCRVGDFIRLRGWVMAHMLWNPSLDEKKLINEFLEGYYGPAAPYLAKYLDIIHTPSKSRPHMPMSHNNLGFLTIDEMNEATRLFNAAVHAVIKEPTYLARVRRDRLPLDHMWLLNYKRYQHDAKVAHTDFLAPDPVVSCKKQLKILHQYPDEGHYFENAGNSGYETWMKNMAKAALRTKRPQAKVPPECSNLSDKEWADFQEDSLWMHYLQDGIAFVDDPLASNGKAIRMPGNVPYKLINLPFFNISYLFPQPVHCYICVRCEAQEKTGLAFTAGISDMNGDVVRKEVFLDEAGDGAYHTIDLGVVNVTPDGIAWALPCGDPDKVKAIYIDRIFFIEKTK